MPQSRRQLSIIYVGTLPPHPGGSALSGSQIIIGLSKLGHRIRALAPITADSLGAGDRFAAGCPQIGVTRFLLPFYETSPDVPVPDDYRKQENRAIQERLRSLIADERPDAILLGRESFVWHVPDIARARSIPCILRTAGSATAMGILKRTYPAALARAMLEQFRKVELIVTPADHMAQSLRELGFHNVRSIPNAVNTREFYPRSKDPDLLRELNIREGDVVVAHVSNLKALKRPLDLVQSAEKALKQNPKLVYLVVGDGDLRAAVEESCRSRNLIEKFRFAGWVRYERMPDYFNLADIVVMASEAEGLARVYLETQACGRLLLASDIPAAREVITDGATGLLFRLGDIDDLTAKTLRAAAEPELRAGIGRDARLQAEPRSLDRVVSEYVAACQGVARKNS